jgi:hypothetical protein
LNLKALYRRARANIQLGEVISHVLLVSFQLILAKSDLAKILKADPENKVAAKELQRVKQLWVKQKRKEMEMSKQIIDNMSYYERHQPREITCWQWICNGVYKVASRTMRSFKFMTKKLCKKREKH